MGSLKVVLQKRKGTTPPEAQRKHPSWLPGMESQEASKHAEGPPRFPLQTLSRSNCAGIPARRGQNRQAMPRSGPIDRRRSRRPACRSARPAAGREVAPGPLCHGRHWRHVASESPPCQWSPLVARRMPRRLPVTVRLQLQCHFVPGAYDGPRLLSWKTAHQIYLIRAREQQLGPADAEYHGPGTGHPGTTLEGSGSTPGRSRPTSATVLRSSTVCSGCGHWAQHSSTTLRGPPPQAIVNHSGVAVWRCMA